MPLIQINFNYISRYKKQLYLLIKHCVCLAIQAADEAMCNKLHIYLKHQTEALALFFLQYAFCNIVALQQKKSRDWRASYC